MSAVLTMQHVFKKFTRGERHDSLRDLVPALAKRIVGRGPDPSALEGQEFWALQDITFDVEQGEAVAFVGHNGAGKSTILKLLSGIMKPTKGLLSVRGRLSALIEVGAGFHQDLTGRENVYLNGVILGMSRAEIRRKFDEIVQFAGLEEFIDTPVKRYSSGMYARLGFSVAAHLEPDILVIDEVLSVGDMAFQTKSIEKMRSILHSGATVIFVSHDLRAVSNLCSRAIMLRRGQVVQDGPSSEVIHTYLDQILVAQSRSGSEDVSIDTVSVQGEGGPRSDFESGDRAWVTIGFSAKRPRKRLDCVLHVVDQQRNVIFNISTEALGAERFSMQSGDRREVCIELALHLPSGSYDVNVALFDSETQRPVEWVQPAAKLLMRSAIPVAGSVNLYPRIATLPLTVS